LDFLAVCIPRETRVKKLPLGKQLRRYGIVNVSRCVEVSLGLRLLITDLIIRPHVGTRLYA
jgi:hypothetical protein